MSTANEAIEEAAAGRGSPPLFPLDDVLEELRAVFRSHVNHGALLVEATGIRLVFAIAISLFAMLAVMLAWAIGCAAGLYYLALATSVLWSVVIGVAVHLAIALALFRLAGREIGRVKAYFTAPAGVREPDSQHTAVS